MLNVSAFSTVVPVAPLGSESPRTPFQFEGLGAKKFSGIVSGAWLTPFCVITTLAAVIVLPTKSNGSLPSAAPRLSPRPSAPDVSGTPPDASPDGQRSAGAPA